jgi:Fic family protein
MNKQLLILSNDLLSEYLEKAPKGLNNAFEALKDAEISTDSFSFYTSVSSVYSSKIEGEDIELDSYIKHKKFGIEFSLDYTKKIDDLYDAYSFAKVNELNKETIAQAHSLVSKNFLTKKRQGKYRTQNMYASTPDGRIEYIAASPFELEAEMEKFYTDLTILLKTEMSIEEAFFYASMIHLVFVKIHPWNDGNGRSARLIEKWFLAEKLGDKAWYVQSEKMYYDQHQTYYSNIRILGLEYSTLDYTKALPFLLILPSSVIKE